MKVISESTANLVVINNPIKLRFLEFNEEIIQDSFHHGENKQKKFINEYLK